MTQRPVSFGNFAIVTFKGNDYRTNFWFMIKSETVNRMKNEVKKTNNYDYNKILFYRHEK